MSTKLGEFFPKKMDWNMQTLEIKTWGVEMALRPIIRSVTALVAARQKPRKKKGCSKKAAALVMAVEVATANFVERGEMIAAENPDAKDDIITVVGDVREHGLSLVFTSREFASDPCSNAKRTSMVRSAQDLLSAVTRLLILADMLDVHILMGKVQTTMQDLMYMRQVSTQPQLMEGMRRLEKSVSHLSQHAGKRQKDLKDPEMRDNLAAARAVLIKQSPMLLTSSNVHVRYPDLAQARQNRDLIHRQMCTAVETIGDIATGKHSTTKQGPGREEALICLLSDMRDCLQNNPDCLSDCKSKQMIKEKLGQIITKAAQFAEKENTREDRKGKILAVCEQLKVLVKGKIDTVDKEISELKKTVSHLSGKIIFLQRLLKKTIADQVSDTFIDSLEPVNELLASAQKGNKKDMIKTCKLLENQMKHFSNLAEMICDMTDNEEGKRMVQLSFQQLKDLKSKLENSIEVFSHIPDSKAAQENVNMFKKSWVEQVKIFMDAVDDIISVNYFLNVVENHVLEDVKHCCRSMENQDVVQLARYSRAIYQRCGRLCDVVSADMERYEPGLYTDRVIEAVKILRKELMPIFSRKVSDTIKDSKSNKDIDENEFIDSCRLIYDGVRDVRHAYLANTDIEEIETEIEDANDTNDTKDEKKVTTPPKEITTIKEAVSKIKTEDIRAELNTDSPVYWVAIWSNPQVRNLLSAADLGGSQVEGFQQEKENLDREVSKWEDSNNDIIVLAKHMCGIMTDMTDFIKGRGKIKTTSDVIDAAKKISEAGKKLDLLARKIADRCPESSSKNDLLAYLGRITLYCHQLNITSKVKADVHNVSGELIVSGLDSATSLIQAARNLMNAVVLTVKASYVASRMYKIQVAGKDSCPPSPIVVWKMKTPEKQPLVRREPPEEFRARVRRADKKQTSPTKALSEFQERRLSLSSCSSVGSVCSVGHS